MDIPQPYPVRASTTRAAPGDHAGGLEFLAWLMDRAIPIPGTPFRVGLDAILGLLPFGGDFVTGLIQAGIVMVALYRYRVPRAVAARMALNVLLDTAVGSIPLVGDLFDAGFKANTRNIQLLREAQEHEAQGEPMPAGPSVRFLVGIGVVLGVMLVLVLIGFVTLVGWLIRRPLI
jgi:hypothetical protein